jgi:hypothetical protein
MKRAFMWTGTLLVAISTLLVEPQVRMSTLHADYYQYVVTPDFIGCSITFRYCCYTTYCCSPSTCRWPQYVE